MKYHSVLYCYIGLLLFVSFSGSIESTESKNITPKVYAVAGEIASIPCYLPEPVEEDEATMILWYRSDVPNPIYTLDLRNVPLQTPKHFPSKEMEGRIDFNVNVHPPVLYINPVYKEDEAEYKCRVDLRRSRTLILQSKLVVIVPPSKPIVTDEHGQRVDGVIGPYDEGSKVVLNCDVDGGKPAPQVTWWRDRTLIDRHYFLTKRGFARNRLALPKIERSDLMTELICLAANTNLTLPKETRVIIDINLYPLSVTLVEPQYPLLAGEMAEISCETVGSRPMALTTWWLDDDKVEPGLPSQKSKEVTNITISTFRFVPKPADNGKRLTCKSINPALPNVTLESDMLLKVHFVPILNISLEHSLDSSNITEGAYVSLICTVWANPKMSEVTWLFNERLIAMNKTERTVTSKFTLPLGRVTREHGGKYRCLAANIVGQGSSNNFHLHVKYSPVCKHSYAKIHGMAESETINVTCEVDAEPPDVIYRWSFVNEINAVILQNWTSNETNSITYSPKAENGYGVLSCLGRNSVGLQVDPCLYKIVPAGAPEPPHDCSVFNQTIINLTVECEAGYNGSLLQIFHMEVYDLIHEHQEQNLTKADKPIFKVFGLIPGTSYLMVLYSSNSKGKSESVAIMVTIPVPIEKTAAPKEEILHLSPALIIIICLISIFVVGIIIFVLVIKFHKSVCIKHRKSFPKKDINIQDFETNSESTKKEVDDNNDTNGKGPDIIPFTIEAEVCKMGDQLQYLSSHETSPKLPVREKYTHTVL